MPWIRVEDTVTTDKDGKWRLDILPDRLDNLSIELSHPDYAKERIWFRNTNYRAEDLRVETCVMVLKAGAMLSGYVVDEAGNPIKDASILLGENHWDERLPRSNTDEDGRFEFDHCQEGDTVVTVTADGYAPELKIINVAEGVEPIEFVLAAGNNLYGRVVDIEGNALEGVNISIAVWREYYSLSWRSKTDEQGLFAWDSAPADEVKIQGNKGGYMSTGNTAVTADGTEYEIVMVDALKVKGSVFDAETSELVKEFKVTRGYERGNNRGVGWNNYGGNVKNFTDGEYEMSFTNPRDGHYLRVDAEGYLPGVSRVFDSNEGVVVYDFELEKGEGLNGVVYDPNGKAAAGADVYLVVKGKFLHLQDGRKPSGRQVESAVTDPNGRFSFRAQTEKYKFVAVHDLGIAEMTQEQFEESSDIYLEKWGRIEGTLYIGSQPGVNENIQLHSVGTQRDPDQIRYSFGLRVITDEQGKFVMERVMPGEVGLSRRISAETSNRTTSTHRQTVEVLAGQTINVTLGGGGRKVVGQLAASGQSADWKYSQAFVTPDIPQDKMLEEIYSQMEFPRPESFDEMTVAEVMQWYQTWSTSEEGRAWQKEIEQTMKEKYGYVMNKHYGVLVQADGSFSIDDVEPGDYVLNVRLYEKGTHDQPDYSKPLGMTRHKFTVPEDEDVDEPLELGLIDVGVQPKIEVDQAAPAFEADALDGGTIKLSDYAGKVLLINFWNFQMSPGGDDGVADVRNVYEQFAGNEQFEVLGLTIGSKRIKYYTELIEKYIKEKGLEWKQGIIDMSDNNLVQIYSIRQWPFNVLVGRDGKIIATGLKGDELETAVAEAVGE
ncbi:carboxypeptidase regulatory-like domain-containing protein, partial [Planctomycetota bacterium]